MEEVVAKSWWKLDPQTAKLVWKVVSLLLIAIVGIVFGLYVENFMSELDQNAREKWKPDL